MSDILALEPAALLLDTPVMFPPGSRVRFFTTFGPRLGTVVEVLAEAIDGDHVHRVRPDDGAFGVMLLLGRSLHPAEVDEPFIVEGSSCSKER